MTRGAILGWSDPNPPQPIRPIVPIAVVLNRVIVGGYLDAVVGALAQSTEVREKLMGLTEGIYPDDPEARAFLAAAGADPDEILGSMQESEDDAV